MPSSTFVNAMGASEKTANLLAGDINEFVPFRANVSIYCVNNEDDVNITVLADSDVVVDDSEVVFVGTSIDKSAHLVDSFVVNPGTRLAIFLRETGAAATADLLTVVDVTPV